MGNLTKKDIVSMTGLIKANYTYAYKDVAHEDMLMLQETWFRSLAVYDKQVVGAAFRRAIETSKMPPTLADILQQVKAIEKAIEPTEAEMWEQLLTTARKATGCVRSFNYTFVEKNGLTQGQNARNEFKAIWQEMPQLLKDYCGNENGLIALTRLTHEELAFEKGRFLKMLPTLKTRAEVRKAVHPDILKLASGALKEIDGPRADQMTLTGTK